MAFNMKEVAALRGDDKKYAERFSQIDWGSTSNNENHIVNKLNETSESNENRLKTSDEVLTGLILSHDLNNLVSYTTYLVDNKTPGHSDHIRSLCEHFVIKYGNHHAKY